MSRRRSRVRGQVLALPSTLDGLRDFSEHALELAANVLEHPEFAALRALAKRVLKLGDPRAHAGTRAPRPAEPRHRMSRRELARID